MSASVCSACSPLKLSRLTRELGEIEDAMMRLEAEPERFGHDERTGEDIPFERLDIDSMGPYARRRTAS